MSLRAANAILPGAEQSNSTNEPRGHFSGEGGTIEERQVRPAFAADVERAIFHLKYCSAPKKEKQEDEDSLSSPGGDHGGPSGHK